MEGSHTKFPTRPNLTSTRPAPDAQEKQISSYRDPTTFIGVNASAFQIPVPNSP